MADKQDYIDLIIPEHSDKEKYLAVIGLHAQAAADVINLLNSLPGLFDIDTAVGEQLDFVGQWIGRTRFLETPLTGVYFSLDIPGQGLDESIWWEPYNPSTLLVRLPDNQYRLLLYGVRAANSWDGTIPGAYTALNTLFQPLGITVLIQDTEDMLIAFSLFVPGNVSVNAVLLGLFTSGALDLKSAGVEIHHYLQSVPGMPFFGLDIRNEYIAGLDESCWAQKVD